MVYSFSKVLEMMKCKNPTSIGAIKFFHESFARFTVSKIRVTVKEFKEFIKDFSILHITTAPYHSPSNEQAERFVGTFKRALKV